jgi:DNA primase
MSEIDRDSFLESLERLLSDDDQEVVAAARTIREQMREAGVTWDMLLVQAPGEDDHDDYVDEEEDEAESPHVAAARAPSDALALIDELLTKHEISDETREELADYKEDIAAGEFTEADHRYLQALYQRVTGRKR